MLVVSDLLPTEANPVAFWPCRGFKAGCRGRTEADWMQIRAGVTWRPYRRGFGSAKSTKDRSAIVTVGEKSAQIKFQRKLKFQRKRRSLT